MNWSQFNLLFTLRIIDSNYSNEWALLWAESCKQKFYLFFFSLSNNLMIEISKSFPEILVSVHVCWVKCGVHNAYSSHLIYEKSGKKLMLIFLYLIYEINILSTFLLFVMILVIHSEMKFKTKWRMHV